MNPGPLARRSLTWGALIGLVLVPGAAGAHPQGPKPIAQIGARGEQVRMLWLVAPDDMRALAEHLGLLEVPPEQLPGEGAFQDYFRDRVSIRAEAGPCSGRVAFVGTDSGSFGTGLSFDCPAGPGKTSIEIALLHDLSPDYVTIGEVYLEQGTTRAAFPAGAPPFVVDFAEGIAEGREDPTGEQVEGFLGRVVASLEGGGSGGLAIALGLSFVLGALHAITPGHGKTIATAYLVGVGGTMRQALGLGTVVTLAHAVSVAILGAIAIRLDELFLPTEWEPRLQMAAGILTLGLGAGLLRTLRRHTHDEPSGPMSLRRLAGIGIVGGLVPGPEAIAVVLVAFAIGEWLAGMALVLAFSLGLAAVVLGVAVAAVRLGAVVRRVASGRLAHAAPRIAAVVFVLMGIALVAQGAVRL